MSEGIQDIETDLITPDSIADEVCAVGLVAGAMLALHRAIATLAPYRVRASVSPSLLHGAPMNACRLYRTGLHTGPV